MENKQATHQRPKIENKQTHYQNPKIENKQAKTIKDLKQEYKQATYQRSKVEYQNQEIWKIGGGELRIIQYL